MKLSDYEDIYEMLGEAFYNGSPERTGAEELLRDVMGNYAWFQSEEHGIVLVPEDRANASLDACVVYAEDIDSPFEWNVTRFLHMHPNATDETLGKEFGMDYIARPLRRLSVEDGIYHK